MQKSMAVITKGDFENKHMPDRNAAYTAIWSAVKTGKLKRGKCRVCGATKTQAHHPTKTYGGTKGIVWLCDKHHRAAHKTVSKSESVEVLKTDDSLRLVWLIVTKPNELDTDLQWFPTDEVELMSYRYMVSYKLGEAGIFEEHKTELSDIFIASSFLAPVDYTINDKIIRQGTWIVVLFIPNDTIWKKIQDRELVGASIRGPATLAPGVMP